MLELAKAMQKEITFHQFKDVSLSAMDIQGILINVLLMPVMEKARGIGGFSPPEQLLTMTNAGTHFGPARMYHPTAGSTALTSISLTQLRDAAYFDGQIKKGPTNASARMQSEIWFGANSLSPQDYLATVAGAVEHHLTTGQWLDPVPVRKGVLGFEKYVAEDSTKLWGWVIFPEGFHAPKLMELARLQAWTLKPALIKRR